MTDSTEYATGLAVGLMIGASMAQTEQSHAAPREDDEYDPKSDDCTHPDCPVERA